MSFSANTEANSAENVIEKARLGWRSSLRMMEWRSKGETFVKYLKVGDFFGEEVILGEEQATSVRAVTYCDLLVLVAQVS